MSALLLSEADSDLFPQPLPADVVASVFANLEVHLVLANYGKAEARIQTAHSYVHAAQRNDSPQTMWILAPRSFQILRRSA